MKRVVGSGSAGVYRRLWSYSQQHSRRRPITITAPPLVPNLRTPYALRTQHLAHTYRRDWMYAQHRAVLRRTPWVPTPAVPVVTTLDFPHPIRFRHLDETYRTRWLYARRVYFLRRPPITITAPVIVEGRYRVRRMLARYSPETQEYGHYGS